MIASMLLFFQNKQKKSSCIWNSYTVNHQRLSQCLQMSDICILSCLQPKQDRTGSNIGLFLHVEFQPWINSRLTDENWVRSQELYYRCTIQPELLQTAMKNLSFSNNIHLHQHPSPGVWIVQIKLQYYFTTTYTRFLCLTRVGTKVTSRHRQIWEKLDFWIKFRWLCRSWFIV